MAERLLVVDASLAKRLATELRARGRASRTVAQIADVSLEDHLLLPLLAAELAEVAWILITGDDAMPAEHGTIIEEHHITVATVHPRWERSGLEQEAFKREVVHRWAHAMAAQANETCRRYSLSNNLPWRALRRSRVH